MAINGFFHGPLLAEETPDDAGSGNQQQMQILRQDRENSRTSPYELTHRYKKGSAA